MFAIYGPVLYITGIYGFHLESAILYPCLQWVFVVNILLNITLYFLSQIQGIYKRLLLLKRASKMEHSKQIYFLDRFSSQIDNRLQGVIKNAINDFNNKMDGCIKIRPKTSQDKDWVDIIKDGGCWSYVGRRQTGRQEISLSKFCTFRSLTILVFLPVAEFCS